MLPSAKGGAEGEGVGKAAFLPRDARTSKLHLPEEVQRKKGVFPLPLAQQGNTWIKNKGKDTI